jgi:flagellar basal-body rod protein FlgG
MIRSLWISKTGMEGQQTKLDAIANNLANVATNGYKRSGVLFEDLMYQNLRQSGAASSEQSQLPTGLQLGLGVRAAATSRNFTPGPLSQTTGQYDVAIEGNGFFQIQLPDGTTGYTRDGAFQLNANGQLVTSAGYAVQPGINIPAALSPGISTNWLCGIGVALSGKTSGSVRCKLTPCWADRLLIGILLGSGAAHPANSKRDVVAVKAAIRVNKVYIANPVLRI